MTRNGINEYLSRTVRRQHYNKYVIVNLKMFYTLQKTKATVKPKAERRKLCILRTFCKL